MTGEKDKFPQGYLEEAMALKERHMEKFKAYMASTRSHGCRGRDFTSREEKKLNDEFSVELKRLKRKYNIG